MRRFSNDVRKLVVVFFGLLHLAQKLTHPPQFKYLTLAIVCGRHTSMPLSRVYTNTRDGAHTQQTKIGRARDQRLVLHLGDTHK